MEAENNALRMTIGQSLYIYIIYLWYIYIYIYLLELTKVSHMMHKLCNTKVHLQNNLLDVQKAARDSIATAVDIICSLEGLYNLISRTSMKTENFVSDQNSSLARENNVAAQKIVGLRQEKEHATSTTTLLGQEITKLQKQIKKLEIEKTQLMNNATLPNMVFFSCVFHFLTFLF